MELYINDTEVDINDRLPFPLTYQINDIRDLSKRKGSTSKTITLPGTQRNVRLMSGVYVVSTTTSEAGTGFDSFDPTIKATARYYEKGILQFEGICQLQNCKKVDGTWSFEVVLFQEQIDIMKLLANYKLSELGWDEYNHNLTATNQQNSWSGSIIKSGSAYNNFSGTNWLGEGYYYGLIDYGYDRDGADIFSVENIAPQVFVKNIVDKMFKKIGVTYDSDFMNTQLFKKLLLAYDGGEFPAVDSATSTANSIETTQLVDGSGNYFSQTVDLYEVIDFNGDETFINLGAQSQIINYNSDSTTPPTDPSNLIQSNVPLKFVAQYNGLYKLTYSGSFDIDLDFTPTGGSGSYTVNWTRNARIQIYKNNQLYQQDFIYNEVNQSSTSLTNSKTVNGTLTFEINLEPSDVVTVVLNFGNSYGISDDGDTATAFESELTIKPSTGSSMELDITLAEQEITEGQPVNIRQFLPEKMTCAEFLKGIVGMFNLAIKPSEQNPKELEIEPLGDFYAGTQDAFGNDITLDWTDIVDHSKDWVVTPTINLATKEYNFKFQDDKDYWNKRYTDDTLEQYGAKQITSTGEFSTGDTTTELPFSQKPLVQIPSTDLIVPRSFQVKTSEGGLATIKPKKGKPFIVQIKDGNVGTLQTGAWTHRSSGGDTAETEYPYVGHLDDIDSPSFDLLYNLPDYVFYTISGGQDYTTNNLYTYHERFIRELVDKNGKMLSCYIKLDPRTINNLDFKKLIKIDGVVYRLQKIENYESGKDDSTKVELIKIIEGDNLQTYTSVDSDDDKYNIDNIIIDGTDIPDGTATKSLGVNSDGKLVKSNTDVGIVLYKAEITQAGTDDPVITEYVNNTDETITGTKTGDAGDGSFIISGFNGALTGNIDIQINESNLQNRTATEQVYFVKHTLVSSSIVGFTQYDTESSTADGLLDSGNHIIITINKY